MNLVNFIKKEQLADGRCQAVYDLSCDPFYVGKALILMQGSQLLWTSAVANVSGDVSRPGRRANVRNVRDFDIIRFDGVVSCMFKGTYEDHDLVVSIDFYFLRLTVVGDSCSDVDAVAEKIKNILGKSLTRRVAV